MLIKISKSRLTKNIQLSHHSALKKVFKKISDKPISKHIKIILEYQNFFVNHSMKTAKKIGMKRLEQVKQASISKNSKFAKSSNKYLCN